MSVGGAREGRAPVRAEGPCRSTRSYPFGYGDGGGGPTRAMLESARRLRDLEGAPRVEIDTVASFWDKVRAEAPDLPVWVGELYLEYHRGTYTTNGPIKRANRQQRAGAARGRAVVGRRGGRRRRLERVSAGRARRGVEAAAAQPVPRHHPGLQHPLGQRGLPARPRADRRGRGRADRRRAQQAIVDTGRHHGHDAAVRGVQRRVARSRRELVEIDADGAPELVPVVGPGVRLRDDRPRRGAGPSFGAVIGHRTARSRTSCCVSTWDDDGLLTSVFDKEHRPGSARARRARQPVPAPRRQPAATSTRGTSTSNTSTIARRSHRDHVDRRRRARSAARRRALRARVRRRRRSRRRCGS